MSAEVTASELFNNRELSWLQFNRRVLDEARSETNGLLERVKFLAIASNNLDEFFEIRVAGTMELVDAGLASGENPDKLPPREELAAIRAAAQRFHSDLHRCWKRELQPALAREGIHFPDVWRLDDQRRGWLNGYFEDEVFPVLTPLAVDPATTLNIYICDLAGGILGFAYLPNSFSESDTRHGVVILYSSLPEGDGGMAPSE